MTPKIGSAAFLAEIERRMRASRRTRRTLAPGGRLYLDRQLPFLFVYRPPEGRADEGTASLVTGEAAYLIAPEGGISRLVRDLVRAIAVTGSDLFGAFLIVEVWAGPDEATTSTDEGPAPPAFQVVTARGRATTSAVQEYVRSLRNIRHLKLDAEVTVREQPTVAPPGATPVVSAAERRKHHIELIGIETRPVYRDPATGAVYPIGRASIDRQLGRAHRKASYAFTKAETTHRPRHYQALGRRVFVKAVTQADSALADISEQFDVLLAVTPVNVGKAYARFARTKGQEPPEFLYRPRDIDPASLKRRLYSIPINRVEDPTMADLFEEKRQELELAISLVQRRETDRFLATSMALYGTVDNDLVAEAQRILDRVSPSSPARQQITGEAFAAAAERSLERYRAVNPAIASRVELHDDIWALTVSKGNLLVGREMKIPRRRVRPLLEHEVGTHIVTYWNGRAQPFRLLSSGLASYDELQEGLAVFAEYLVDGLTPERLRTLGARVVAARSVVDGADFVETTNLLRERYGFSRRSAFLIAMRVHRGGGFVKDAVYLRGLHRVLDYLASGGRIETLLTGKINTAHVSLIEELQRRRVLNPLATRPAYLDDPDALARLDTARDGLDLELLVTSE
jgi:uncharacterized protein (TIGR02421 family)